MNMNKDSLFLDLLSKNIISIVFLRDGARIRVEKQEEYDSYFNNEKEVDEFVSNGFDIVSDMKFYLTENEEIDEDKRKILQEILRIKPEYKDDLFVKSQSKLNLINTTSYEILTKRDKNNIANILTYSAMINLEYNNIDDEFSKNRNITFELTRDDLSKLIDKLSGILKDLDNV